MTKAEKEDFEKKLVSFQWWLLSRDEQLWAGTLDMGYRIEIPYDNLMALGKKYDVEINMIVGG